MESSVGLFGIRQLDAVKVVLHAGEANESNRRKYKRSCRKKELLRHTSIKYCKPLKPKPFVPITESQYKRNQLCIQSSDGTTVHKNHTT